MKNLQEQFFSACSEGNLAKAKRLHEAGVAITAKDNQAIFSAACLGHLHIVKWLKENGADINARRNRVVYNAAEYKHMDVVFYLLENGALITEVENKKIIATHVAVEAEILSFSEKNKTPPSENIRSLFYAAAYTLYNSTDNINKLQEAIRNSVSGTLKKTVLSPKTHAAFIEPEIPELVDEAARKIGFAYPKIKMAMDVVSAYVDTVLLGQWLFHSGKNPSEIKGQTVSAAARKLRPAAERILYGDLGLLEIIRYSEAWHNHPLPDSMRPLLAGQWHPLIAPQTSPYKANIGNEETPAVADIVITPLYTQSALTNESKGLNHYVGRTNFGTKCMNGEIHILSIQSDGKSLATLEIELDSRSSGGLVVKQFRGHSNEEPPEEARKAWA